MYRKIVEFQPAISSENIGDEILQYYIKNELKSIFDDYTSVSMPTRSLLTKNNYSHLNNCDFAFILGTNLLASNMFTNHQWKLTPLDGLKLSNLILIGVGWWQYQKKPSRYTSWLLNSIMSNKYMHSVRDE